MHCENIFCIYWADNHCILNKISLDICGNCQDCIHVDINKDILKNQREIILKHYKVK